MEQESNKKILKYKHISSATEEILTYIKERKNGVSKSLATRWSKFNNLSMGGIEPGIIMTIAGISGSGKSSFVNTLETDLIDLNQDENVVVLSFSYEMHSSRQVGRKLSYKLRKTTSELYSVDADKRSSGNESDDFHKIQIQANIIKKYPIYYVDSPGTVEEMGNTISFFQNVIAKNKWLVVIIDHTLLIKGSSNEGERSIIVNLEKMLIEAKKIGKTSILQISQMNRNIESSERHNNPGMHYPMRSDLSSSDAIFQASDYVIIIHRPEILGLNEYGPDSLPVADCIYIHFLKKMELCREIGIANSVNCWKSLKRSISSQSLV